VLLEVTLVAAELGTGSLQLTSRGNLQLRGLADGVLPELVERVATIGLLPSVTHERVRNVIASPLTGLDVGDPKVFRQSSTGPNGTYASGRTDLRPMVSELDRALCDTAELAELPGRFLFALDDGRGDVSALRFDLAYRAEGPGAGTVLVGSAGHGIPTTRSGAVNLMVALAVRFVRLRQDLRPAPWHLGELHDLTVIDRRIAPVGRLESGPRRVPTSPAPPLGARGHAASVGVPLSLLSRGQVTAIHAAAGGGPVVLTPWRGVVIPGAAAALPALSSAGLTVDDESIWSQLTACVGAPGCAKSAISTRAMATEIAARLAVPVAHPVHLSGCPRRCGAPSTAHLDLVAPESAARALALIQQAQLDPTRPEQER
jgi:precorrin-3B synthase